MIRTTDAVLVESSKRGCAPLEPFLLGLRMQLWPLFQKGMSDNVESLKKLADSGGSSAGAFAGFGASVFGAGKGSLNAEVVQKARLGGCRIVLKHGLIHAFAGLGAICYAIHLSHSSRC